MLPDHIKNFIKHAVLGATVITNVSLIVVATSHSQTITGYTSILSSIQQSFDWKGNVKAFASNSNAKSCKNLLAVFGPVKGEVSRYDFVIREYGSSADSQMVACVEVYSDGVLSLEYFPASVFDPKATLG